MLFARKTYKNSTDEDLMRDICKGNDRAFEELYGRYNRRMHSHFYRMLYQDTEKADDFTQDLFMKIVERPEMFDVNRRFSTWLYTVAGNMIKNEYRRNSKYKFTNNVPDGEITECASYLPDPLDQELFEEELQSAVNGLQDHHKECFVLRYQEEKSVREISEIVGCPEGTVKSRLFYSVKKLSDKLKTFK